MQAPRRSVLAAALVAIALLAPSPARADDDPGARGIEAARAGRYADAIVLFKEANAVEDRAEWLCNIGNAYRYLEDLPRAHLFLSACLARASAMSADSAAAFRTVLADVETALRGGDFAPVDVVVTPAGALIHASGFGDDERVPGPLVVWLPFGAHTLTVAAPGHADAAVEVAIDGRDRVPVAVTLEPIRPIVPIPDELPDVVPPREPVASPRRSRRGAWIATTGAGVALAVGVGFHVTAWRTRNDIAAHYPFPDDARAERERTWKGQVAGMAIGYAVAAGAAGIAAYLWHRAVGDTRVTPAAAVGTSGATLLLGWTI